MPNAPVSRSRPAGPGGSYWVGVLGLRVKQEAWVNGHSVSPPLSLLPHGYNVLSFVSMSALSKAVAMELLSNV